MILLSTSPVQSRRVILGVVLLAGVASFRVVSPFPLSSPEHGVAPRKKGAALPNQKLFNGRKSRGKAKGT